MYETALGAPAPAVDVSPKSAASGATSGGGGAAVPFAVAIVVSLGAVATRKLIAS